MRYLLALLIFVSSLSYAGGSTTTAIPTRVDIDRGYGFMVYGIFGNVGECTVVNRFYVQNTHPQYDKIYSTVLAAFMSGKKVQAYIHSCAPVAWYSVETITYNTMGPAGTLYLMN